MFSRKLYSNRIIIVLIAVVILCNVVKYIFYLRVQNEDQKAKVIQIKDIVKKYAKSKVCKQPVLPLNSPEILKFKRYVAPITCSKPIDWAQCIESECFIKEKIKSEKGQINCSFTDILRADDYIFYYGETTNTDSYYKLEKSDTVKISCVSNHEQWSSVLTGIRLNKTIWERSGWQYVPKNNLMVNVLMLGYDSLSHNAFIRSLPLTYDYLINHLKAHVLESYNIVGDGTPQALTPILTGKTELELPDVRKRFLYSVTTDVYPFVWKDFQANGYVTAFLEDQPKYGTYTYRLKGFKEPPTDHYMRTYYLVLENGTFPRYCVGEVPRHKIMLNYIEQFFSLYKSKPKFLFGFHGQLSHNEYNKIRNADEDILKFLQNIEKNNVLNNTILILMSDHGHRFSDIRKTIQGKQEERLPFFSFRFPPWFNTTYQRIYENFISNLETLTTPFDIYSTLKDVLNLESPDVGSLKNRSISLFSKIPKERSCSLAGIEPHWCACLDWKMLELNSTIAQRLSNTFVNTINSYTQNNRNICANLQVSKIEWVMKLKPNDRLLQFRQAHDQDGFIPDLTAFTKLTSHIYQIKALVIPGDSLFEATITHNLTDNRLYLKMSDISRINKYGAQARCIENTYPNLRKYCYCTTD